VARGQVHAPCRVAIWAQALWSALAAGIGRRRQVTLADQALHAGGVHARIVRLSGGQAIDVPVEKCKTLLRRSIYPVSMSASLCNSLSPT
jgi:hypothetical protein